jgi:hypothetical protein
MRQVSPIDVYLLIDDMHQLGGPAPQAVLAEIVRHLPSNGHIVPAAGWRPTFRSPACA